MHILRVAIPFIIAFVSFSASCAVINNNSEHESHNDYDNHAKKVAIATVVMFVFDGFVVIGILINESNTKRDTVYTARVFMVISSGAYFVFSTVFVFYALNHDMMTSSERNSYNRRAATTVVISAAINWGLMVILISSEIIVKFVKWIIEYRRNRREFLEYLASQSTQAPVSPPQPPAFSVVIQLELSVFPPSYSTLGLTDPNPEEYPPLYTSEDDAVPVYVDTVV